MKSNAARLMRLLLLLLLVLHLLLPLLQLLQHLLRRARSSRGTLRHHLHGGTPVDHGRLHGGIVGLRLLRNIFIRGILLDGPIGRGRGIPGAAGAEYDLSRGSRALVTDHQHVVARPVQKLRDDVPRRTGSELSKDSLIRADSFYLRAGVGRNLVQNFVQAGIGGLDA